MKTQPNKFPPGGSRQLYLIGESKMQTKLNSKQLTALRAIKQLGYRLKQVMPSGEVQLEHDNRRVHPCYINQLGCLINHRQIGGTSHGCAR